MSFTLLVPSQTGLEAVVERQLASLGYADTKAYNGRIRIDNADWTDVAKLNMFLRSGERVLINVANFPADNFDMLYEGVYNVDWKQYLTNDSAVTVITKTVNSKLFAHHSIQSIGKKAIVAKMRSLTEQGAQVTVELAILNDIVSVNIDTTGEGLHKRGYRSLAYSAPLKETTASALIDLSVWNADKTFSDVFCGSGTLPIEACIKALNIAPGINRTFDFVSWSCVPANVFNDVVTLAKDGVTPRKLEVLGCDINPEAISIAEYHAKRAGVDKYVKFQVADARNFFHNGSYGVNISNPPYGERLGTEEEVKAVTKAMGQVYRKLDKWNFYFLSPYQQFEKDFGRRADKKRYVFNAGIKCSYYTFNGPKPPKNT